MFQFFKKKGKSNNDTEVRVTFAESTYADKGVLDEVKDNYELQSTSDNNTLANRKPGE